MFETTFIGGHFTFTDTSIANAYKTAVYLTGRHPDRVTQTVNVLTGRTVYMKNKRVSVYVKDGVEDWSKAR